MSSRQRSTVNHTITGRPVFQPHSTGSKLIRKPKLDSNLPTFAKVPNPGYRGSSNYLKNILRQEDDGLLGLGFGTGNQKRSKSARSLPPANSDGMMTTSTKNNYTDYRSRSNLGMEDYQQEMFSIKRNASVASQENAVLKTKIQRLTCELTKKDKELDELLSGSKPPLSNGIPASYMRLSTGSKDGKLLVNGLKQKIMRLEQTLQDKQVQLTKVKSDMKMIKVQELRTQCDAFYQELLRLKYQGGQLGAPQNQLPKQLSEKMKSMSETIMRQNEAASKLATENKMLREKLEGKDGSENDSDDGSEKKDYSHMSKAQLISMLNKKQRMNGLKTSPPLDKEKLDTMVKRLKEDRQHYKQKVEAKNKEIESLEKKLRNAEHQIKEMEVALKREKTRSSSSNSRKLQPITNLSRDGGLSDEKDSTNDKSDNDSPMQSPVRTPRRKETESAQNSEDMVKRIESFKRNNAAKKIQRQWRNYRTDEALDLITGVAKGHLARSEYLQSRPKENNLRRASDDSNSSQY